MRTKHDRWNLEKETAIEIDRDGDARIGFWGWFPIGGQYVLLAGGEGLGLREVIWNTSYPLAREVGQVVP
jgi:hypothetical protein